MSNDTGENEEAESTATVFNRRDALRAISALGLTSMAGGAAWAALEFSIAKENITDWRKSVCRYCGTGCGVQVGMSGKKIVEVRGDEDAHNQGKLCIKGSLLPLLNELPGRLTQPLIKKDGKLTAASWDEAMQLISTKFRESIDKHGPNSVAFYGSGQLYTEESYTANKLFKAGIGTNNVDGNPRLCMASAAVGYVRVYGKDEPPGAYEDIDHAHVIVLIGANPAECHQPLFERMLARRRANPQVKIICIDPRRTMTAEYADMHIAPQPGSDLLLLWAMAHVIVTEGLVDREFVDQYVKFAAEDGAQVTYEDVEEFLADYAPAAVEQRLGVSQATIIELAYLFANSPATMSMWTMGLNQRVDGVALNTTINALHLLTGQIGRPGATPMSLTGQANACGGVRDTGSLSHLLPHGRLIANAEHRKEMAQLWGVPEERIQDTPGLHAIELFQAMKDGRVKCMLNMCTNPGQSLPNLGLYEQALEQAFLVVVDTFENTATSKFADVVLPAALWVEKAGVYGQSERRYQLLERLLDPPGEARSDLDILTDLAQRLGYGDLITARTPEQVWDEYRALSAHSLYNFSGMTRERLRQSHGLQWPCPTEDHPGTVRRYVFGDPYVPDGASFAFYGQKDGRAVVHLVPYEDKSDKVDADYPMVLTTGRIVEQWHTGTMTDRIPEIFENTLRGHFEMHHADASRLQLNEGDRIEVKSRYGELQGAVRVTDSPRVGTLFASFYDEKWLINRVVTDLFDPLSKQPDFKTTAVAVTKVTT